MSDTVDNVMNVVNESEPTEDVVVSEETSLVNEDILVEAPTEEVAEPEPVASASETEAAEPEPVAEPVSVEEVVQNVQEILTTPVNEDLSDKERLVQLEKRVDDLVTILRSVYRSVEFDDEQVECIDFKFIKDKLNNV